jgi:hypothetical protein
MRGSLSLIVHGAYFDGLGEGQAVTPIDSRYTEPVESSKPPIQQRLSVGEAGAWLDLPLDVRLVCVHNISGKREAYPSEEEAAAIASQVLLVGVSDRRTDSAPSTPIRLLPALCGQRPGGCQSLWLTPGSAVFLLAESPRPVDVFVQIFCG